MRAWPFRRLRAVQFPVAPEPDLLVLEQLLRGNVEDLFVLEERQIRGQVVSFRGRLLLAPGRALDLLERRFKPFGYTPFLQQERGQVWIRALPVAGVTEAGNPMVNLVLFVATCLSTLVAGSGAFLAFNPFTEPARLLSGVPFAFTLLSILGVHEFGHYFTARYYRAAVSLPYFIPAPPPFIFGTLGAIIKMKSPPRDRDSLFDIAAAGPLAGLVVAIPALVIGLQWSRMIAIPPGYGGLIFGDSLMMRFLVYLTFGSIPEGMDILIHPVGLAGWVGLFVTALNLFPVGQLDGGRIAYALFGVHHRKLSLATFVALLAMGAVTGSLNWVVWAALLFFLIGFHHSPPLNDLTPLSSGRYLVGAICLILLVLLVPPIPIQVQ
ncbi:MAG: site-2 protease family protein [Candidatus Methylomirabilia bacterium]